MGDSSSHGEIIDTLVMSVDSYPWACLCTGLGDWCDGVNDGEVSMMARCVNDGDGDNADGGDDTVAIEASVRFLVVQYIQDNRHQLTSGFV
ncbi:hypothetical protein ACRALDRAFT_2021689 [Sodiomyces alcalophilus JCM 7366]|uniref:uncharacterized protein n=1 Tax=Sodiomyces alcalophilus JCM 7366 TaxID=591952 RepID=UPI0039B48D30